MPLELRLRPVLALTGREGGRADTPMTVRRAQSARQSRSLGWMVMRPGPKVEISHRFVPVEGGKILVRLYRPTDAGTGPLPLHVFLHGGGWCVGTLDERDPRCRAIAGEGGCVVASLDYRMAPENAFPVPVEDCYAALGALLADATGLGIDPARVSIGGESAGANLAAVVALLARDRSGPALCFQWLDVPATDLTMEQPSIDRLATGYGLTKQDMIDFRACYVPKGVPYTDPRLSPFHAEDLHGLPSALIMTAEFDPLQDDGAVYAERLRAAGVPVQDLHLDGHVHASFAFTRLLSSSRRYEQTAIAALRASWRR